MRSNSKSKSSMKQIHHSHDKNMLEEPAYENINTKGQVTPIKVTPYNPHHCSPCASTNSMKDLKLPGYDPNIQYDSEFYNMFISN